MEEGASCTMAKKALELCTRDGLLASHTRWWVLKGIDKFVDDKCTARKGRERRKTELKNKMLDQVRDFERWKRDLSTDSICLSFGSPSRRRQRSESEEEGAEIQQSKLCKSQPVKA